MQKVHTFGLPFIITSLLLLLLSLWWITTVPDDLDMQGAFSVTTLMSAEEIIRQLTEQQETTTTSGGQRGRKPTIKEDIEAAKHRLPRSQYKAARSLYKRMAEHVDKLQKYRQNPSRYDNEGLLRNAPNDQVRQQIMQTRITKLERQIEGFYKEIYKIIN